MSEERPQISVEDSPRFQEPVTRRDFLGLSAIWTCVAAFATALMGALRLPMPSVFPEANTKVKIGKPDVFLKGSVTHFSELSVWLFRDDEGLYAISSICTHLGCIARREESGQFHCPCHGSAFTEEGKVVAGPAPKGLNWLELSVSPDGQIVVDKNGSVPMGTHLTL
jgi:cytochrome b6-f complex iron-sulfur subunit